MSQTPKRRAAASPRPSSPGASRAMSSDPSARPTEGPAAGAAEGAPAGPPPLRLNVAAGVAGLEGLAVAAWGVTMCFTGGDKGVLAGLLVLVLAALPLGAAYGLRRARSWSRGPALIMQLLCLPIAWTMLKSDGAVVAAGAVLGVLALAGLAVLVHPATTDALGIRRRTLT
ncbi:hypothetical protein VSR01_26865 [Actinacidiphila sp. DG2A-62]|uniref:hypothetical protein n=1 Tax=Actinacidiphila sp. DG2A-62 TaxID=3108821 RepID=UPI002DBD6269|nr:hypothetical protein [Actinacidiphila sp. DG2A-62]MEC3996936.1 hypothetical protein [Actinacidiphila sp. DG2A-62]